MGWTVKLAEPTADHPEGWKLRWSPMESLDYTFQMAPMDKRAFRVLVREDGVTAYQCVD